MRILITGASGMIGRNLLADARSGQHEILAPDRRALDLRDAAATAAYLRTHKPDAVVHLAAVVGGIQANIDEPVRFLGENLAMGLNVLNAARGAGVTRLLNVASSCMYPRDFDGTLSPDLLLSARLEPTNEGYALAKIVTWKLAEYMAREDEGLVYKTVVPCNLYGRYDHFDAVRSHLVPAAVMKVLGAIARGAPTIEIWGDGTARREFMFGADLADFIWEWLPRLGDLPDLTNVGVGADHTVTEYYETVARVAGYRGGFVYDPSRPAGMKRKLLDVSQQRRLGWQPGTPLETGIRETIAYYRSLQSRTT